MFGPALARPDPNGDASALLTTPKLFNAAVEMLISSPEIVFRNGLGPREEALLVDKFKIGLLGKKATTRSNKPEAEFHAGYSGHTGTPMVDPPSHVSSSIATSGGTNVTGGQSSSGAKQMPAAKPRQAPATAAAAAAPAQAADKAPSRATGGSTQLKSPSSAAAFWNVSLKKTNSKRS